MYSPALGMPLLPIGEGGGRGGLDALLLGGLGGLGLLVSTPKRRVTRPGVTDVGRSSILLRTPNATGRGRRI